MFMSLLSLLIEDFKLKLEELNNLRLEGELFHKTAAKYRKEYFPIQQVTEFILAMCVIYWRYIYFRAVKITVIKTRIVC